MTAGGGPGLVASLPPTSHVRVEAARFGARHPEWWVVGIALVAWAVLVVPNFTAPTQAAMHGGAHHSASLSGSSVAGKLTAGAWTWLLMVIAMMFPMLVPRVRRVAAASIGVIRNEAIAETLAGALLVWSALGVAVVAVAAVVPTIDASVSPVAFGVVWLLVAAWQLTPTKRRSIRSCHHVRVFPGVTDGRRRLRAGAVYAGSCAPACIPAMVAMMLTGHSVLLMAVVTVGFLAELVAHRPDRAARGLAAAVACFACVPAVVALVR